MKYYLVNQDGHLSTVIPDDAREEYKSAANQLMNRDIEGASIDDKQYIRAYGVIDGGRK